MSNLYHLIPILKYLMLWLYLVIIHFASVYLCCLNGQTAIIGFNKHSACVLSKMSLLITAINWQIDEKVENSLSDVVVISRLTGTQWCSG